MAPALHRPMLALQVRCIALLADRLDASVLAADEAAVAVGSARLEAQHRDLGAALQRLDQAAQRGGLDQRRVGEQHDHVALVALDARAVRPAPRWRCRPASPARTPRCRVPPSPPRRAPPPCPAPPRGRFCQPPPRARWRARAPASSGRRWRAAPWGADERMRTPLPAASTTISRGCSVMLRTVAVVLQLRTWDRRMPRNLRAGHSGPLILGRCTS